jgi:hypothetical protein
MAVTIAILSSLCATIAGFLIHQMSVNSVLKKTVKDAEKRIKDLETELEKFGEEKRIVNENNQDRREKKLPRKPDFTNVYRR